MSVKNVPAGDDRVVLITGASSGIGEALALVLAEAGWRVVIAARRREALEAVAERGGAARDRLFPRVVDVTDEDSVRQVVQSIEAAIGELDTVIFNAGDYEPTGLDDLAPETFAHIMQVNYLGAVNGLAAALAVMRPRSRGQILLTGSLSAYRGLPRAAAYGASKAAVVNLAESLRPEAEQAGISLRVINPGFVKSRLTDKNDFRMPQLMTPQAAAQRIAARLDDADFEIFFPRRLGWTLKLLRVLPYRVYFALMRRLVTR